MDDNHGEDINIHNKDIDCPYPFVAPDISKIKENVTLTQENCEFRFIFKVVCK